MQQVLEILSKGLTGSIIGILGIVVGAILSFIFYRSSRIGPRPVFQVNALRIIGDVEEKLPTEVEIIYKGKKVNRLTRTNVVIWNSGTMTLNGKEVIEHDPIRVKFNNDAEILRAVVIKRSRDVNNFNVQLSTSQKNEAICSFDYLDTYDGAVIEILHTDKQKWPKVVGTIRGVPKGILDWGRVIEPRMTFLPFKILGLKTKLGKLPLYIMLVLGILLLVGSIINVPFINHIELNNERDIRVAFAITGAIYAFLPGVFLWTARKRFPKSLSLSYLSD